MCVCSVYIYIYIYLNLCSRVLLHETKKRCDRNFLPLDMLVIISHTLPSPLCLLSSCYNCGGLDHHAKECGLPPQPKKCHYCQSITHMVAQCPHKALAPATGSQDQHASTSAFSPGTGPYLCPPEEEERSGSSPLEGSSSSPEEPHTRGPRTQRWRKSWKQPVEVNLFTANPWPSCLPPPPPQSRIPKAPTPLIYLTPVKKKWEVLISLHFILFVFFFIIFFFKPAQLWQRSPGYRRAWMCVTDSQSYGKHRWSGDCREWLFFFFSLFQSVQLKSETTWYKSWFWLPFFFFFVCFFFSSRT